jgi:thioredoxin-related protein
MWVRRFLIMASLLALALMAMTVSGVTDPSKSTDQPAVKKEIKWLGLEQGLKKASDKEKPVFIDVYTNWCGFCKKMDRETFTDEGIIDYLNENFVPVKLNAESNDKMDLPSGTYTGRQVARSFSVRGYPTYVFLDPNGNKIYARAGYAPPQAFIYVLRYVGDGHYKSKTLDEYYREATAN